MTHTGSLIGAQAAAEPAPACPYCTSRRADLVRHKIGDAETAPFFETRHSLYRCRDCDLYFAAPLTPELTDGMKRFFEVYNVVREHDPNLPTKMVLDTWRQPRWQIRAARTMGQLRMLKWRATGYAPHWGFGRIAEAMTLLYAHGARTVLDVGCAYGGFVKAAALAGFDIYGIEPTRPIVDLIRRNGGWRVSYGFFPDSHGPRERYDAVTFIHALTHFHPITTDMFRRCREIINPGGTLIVFCSDPARFGEPDLESAQYSPLTLSHTSEAFMRRAAEDAGFSGYQYQPSIGEPICCFHLLSV